MTVYHGSTVEIKVPDLLHSKHSIDFGPGFYLTTFADQAERWALRRALRTGGNACVNVYELDMEAEDYRIKVFKDADRFWLDFISDCRKGGDAGAGFDIVMGQVANDAVFEAVNMYLDGVWDAERTLEEIKYYKRNDQIVLKSQRSVDHALRFVRSYVPEVKI